MQAARNLVGLVFEFGSRVQGRQNDLQCRNFFLRMDIHRNSATIINDRNPIIGMDDDIDFFAIAGQRLVHRIVHHLVDQVVQSHLAGRTDIHSRTFAHRLQTLKDRNIFRAVGFFFFVFIYFVCHFLKDLGFRILNSHRILNRKS